MTVWQKTRDVLLGIAMIGLAGLMVLDSKMGFDLIIAIVSVGLLFFGIKSLYFYQTMARHMVGGRMQLYRGIILLNLGMFTVSLNSIPKVYIILYLMGIHAFAGIIDLLRARESKQMDSPHWIYSLALGIGNLGMAILCVVLGIVFKKAEVVVFIYAAGLVYAGVARIINAFKKTEIVYIQ